MTVAIYIDGAETPDAFVENEDNPVTAIEHFMRAQSGSPESVKPFFTIVSNHPGQIVAKANQHRYNARVIANDSAVA